MSDLTWTFAYNTTPTDQTSQTQLNRSLLIQFKEFLVAHGWTVTNSSDSSSVSASDLWGTTLSKVVGVSSGARSWIVLKSPAGFVAGLDGSYTGDQSRVWLLIDCLGNLQLSSITLKIDRVALTGGTTSSPPSNATTVTLLSAAFQSITTSGCLLHFAAAQNGHFICLVNQTGQSRISTCFGILPVINPEKIASSGLDYPFGIYTFVNSSTTSTGALTVSLTGSLWNSSGTAATNAAIPVCLMSSGGSVLGAGFSSTTDLNGYAISSDVYLVSTASGSQMLLGRIADIQWSGMPNLPQFTVDNVTTPTKIFVGSWWIPTNVQITA